MMANGGIAMSQCGYRLCVSELWPKNGARPVSAVLLRSLEGDSAVVNRFGEYEHVKRTVRFSALLQGIACLKIGRAWSFVIIGHGRIVICRSACWLP